MNRRKLIKNSAIVAAFNMLPSHVCGQVTTEEHSGLLSLPWSNNIPPIFCIAYIDPGIKKQRGQEAIVAKYPLAIVSQDHKIQSVRWRDKVKSINPGIKLLGYQMVIEETTVPGVGHERLSKAGNSWVTYPGGWHPKVKLATDKVRRIYDPRSGEWQEAFLDGCAKTLESYPFEGLFLDQCTIFNIASLSMVTRTAMLGALRSTLLELRRRFPSKIFIGNSSYSFAGLNGELNENRDKDLPKKNKFLDAHAEPEFNLYQFYTQDIEDYHQIKMQMKLAYKYKRFFGVSSNYQKVQWFDFFDDVIKQHRKGLYES
jgi:hypothetical protein